MSSIPDDLALKLEWWRTRDYLLGENGKPKDVVRALELASTCKHPDAQWLTEVCAGKDVKTKEDLKAVFLSQGNEARALCFASLIDDVPPGQVDPRLRSAAEMNYDFAQVKLAGKTLGVEGFALGMRALEQGERDAFYRIGWSYNIGNGCERDLQRAREHFLAGARLDSGEQMKSNFFLF